MSSTTRRIAIVGAGLGGFVCARTLQQRGIPVAVFEREANPDSRSQGGTLDIRDDTGLVGLRAAGPFDRIGFRGPLDWRQGVDLADTEAVRAHLLGMFEGFDEGLRDLMRYNGGAFINRPVACRRALAPLSKREGVVRHGVGTVALR